MTNDTKQVLVEIIIPTYKQLDMVKDCVDAIEICTKVPHITYLVDDGSGEEFQKQLIDLVKDVPNTKVVCNPNNQGFGRNVNSMWKKCTAPYVLLLNNDTQVQLNFLEEMLRPFEHNKYIGIVGAKLLYPNKTIQFAGMGRNVFNPKWFDHHFRNQPEGLPAANQPKELICSTGACLLVKREVNESLKGDPNGQYFDDNFQMAFEDVDFCFRARKKGWKVWYQPTAVVIHYEGATRGTDTEEPRQKASQAYFWKKWNEEEVDDLSFINGVITTNPMYDPDFEKGVERQ